MSIHISRITSRIRVHHGLQKSRTPNYVVPHTRSYIPPNRTWGHAKMDGPKESKWTVLQLKLISAEFQVHRLELKINLQLWRVIYLKIY